MTHRPSPGNFSGKTSIRARVFSALIAFSFASSTAAQINFVASVVEREIEFGRVISEDLNGDGLLDLIDTRWRRGIGRELLIYQQERSGRYSSTPQVVEIKTEIIAVGFADLRPEPGKELVLLANNGVFSLSTALEGYTGNLKPLFEWQLIADVPDPDRVQFFTHIQDVNGDDLADILIPGEKTYGLFVGTGGEGFRKVTEFSTINLELDPGARPSGDNDLSADIEINSQDGIKLNISARQPTPFDGFVSDWSQGEEANNLLRAENFMPPAQLADFNGDGRDDIVFLNVGLDLRGQVNLLYQKEVGGYNDAPDWRGPIDTRGDIRLVDLDGDEITDVAKINGEGNEYDIAFYVNREGRIRLRHTGSDHAFLRL